MIRNIKINNQKIRKYCNKAPKIITFHSALNAPNTGDKPTVWSPCALACYEFLYSFPQLWQNFPFWFLQTSFWPQNLHLSSLAKLEPHSLQFLCFLVPLPIRASLFKQHGHLSFLVLSDLVGLFLSNIIYNLILITPLKRARAVCASEWTQWMIVFDLVMLSFH